MLPRSVPDLSLYVTYRFPLTGFTAACGNALERKPRPRSPLLAVVVSVATVTAAAKVRPRSVERRTLIVAGVVVLSYQNAYSEWSGPTVIHAPCTLPALPETMLKLPVQVVPWSVERKK